MVSEGSFWVFNSTAIPLILLEGCLTVLRQSFHLNLNFGSIFFQHSNTFHIGLAARTNVWDTFKCVYSNVQIWDRILGVISFLKTFFIVHCKFLTLIFFNVCLVWRFSFQRWVRLKIITKDTHLCFLCVISTLLQKLILFYQSLHTIDTFLLISKDAWSLWQSQFTFSFSIVLLLRSMNFAQVFLNFEFELIWDLLQIDIVKSIWILRGLWGRISARL